MNLKTNFKYFQIQKRRLRAGTAEKVDEKNGVICVVFIFPSWVMVFKLSKKVHFFKFVLNSAKKPKMLKQFTYKHLEGLVTHFQKLLLFTMLLINTSKILVFEIEKFVKFLLIQHRLWYFNCYHLISGGSDPNKPYHFLKDCNGNFQIHVCKLL